MSTKKIRFNNRKNPTFAQEVRQRVNEYFEEKGISQHANTAMVIKTITLFAVTLIPYILILTGNFTPWQMLGLAVITGFGITGLGFSVAHDALHGAYSANPTVNKILGLTFPLIGVSDYLWKIKHNVLHHTYTNIYEHDEDLTVTKFLRLSPNAPHKPIHRIQHVLAFFAYTMLSVGWIFLFDYKKILRYSAVPGSAKHVPHPRAEIVKIFVSKALFYFYAIALPLIVLPIAWWQVLGGFFIMQLVVGFTITIIFQLAHVVEGTDHPLPEEDGLVDNAWMIHQVETTSNFGTKNKFLTWYVGGLNFQTEHHLFPKVCSIHYPAINPIVKEVAAEYGVKYNENPSFWAAVKSHYKILKQFSKPNMDPVKWDDELKPVLPAENQSVKSEVLVN